MCIMAILAWSINTSIMQIKWHSRFMYKQWTCCLINRNVWEDRSNCLFTLVRWIPTSLQSFAIHTISPRTLKNLAARVTTKIYSYKLSTYRFPIFNQLTYFFYSTSRFWQPGSFVMSPTRPPTEHQPEQKTITFATRVEKTRSAAAIQFRVRKHRDGLLNPRPRGHYIER